MRLIGRSLCTIMIAVSFLVLSGCKALDTEFAYQLTLSESSIVFDMHGAEKSLSVAPFPEKEKWTAAYAEEEDWFTFEAVSDALLVAVLLNLRILKVFTVQVSSTAQADMKKLPLRVLLQA